MKRNLLFGITLLAVIITACKTPLTHKNEKETGAPEIPQISAHPQGAKYPLGVAAPLTVTASVVGEGVLSYQWFSNAVNSKEGGTLISGATEASFMPPTDTIGTTYYYCVVTNALNRKTTEAISRTAKIEVGISPLTVSGLSAADKFYDGTTEAEVVGIETAVLHGLVVGHDVALVPGIAAFASASVGNNKLVTFSGWSLGGADAAKYTLSEQPASVTANITKAPGAAVSAPTVKGIPGYNSITVNDVSLLTATEQSVEYAISTANDGTGLSAWQSGTTFGGLATNETYYVYARSVANVNYLIGTPSVSAGIRTGIEVTITFNSNGGSSVPAIIITRGTSVPRPANPTRQDWVFDCWNIDPGLTTPYYFSEQQTIDITLYARWVPSVLSNTDNKIEI